MESKKPGNAGLFFLVRFHKENQQYFNPCQLYAFRAGPTSAILERRLRLSTRPL
nr:MAG TPA: hypothetical protein [Caudoviricetes sp.]